jgi:hypothetical protein
VLAHWRIHGAELFDQRSAIRIGVPGANDFLRALTNLSNDAAHLSGGRYLRPHPFNAIFNSCAGHIVLHRSQQVLDHIVEISITAVIEMNVDSSFDALEQLGLSFQITDLFGAIGKRDRAVPEKSAALGCVWPPG